MAPGTRSRASRPERRLHKERAASALQHGLPGPMPLPTRGAVSTASGARLSSNPAAQAGSPARAAAKPRLPLSLKLLGLGLALLGLVYGLTLLRDHKSVAEPARISPSGMNAVK
ncbi:MAG TPA: hypothetical protein VGC79_22845 [Polyangiaceae bacterium]